MKNVVLLMSSSEAATRTQVWWVFLTKGALLGSSYKASAGNLQAGNLILKGEDFDIIRNAYIGYSFGDVKIARPKQEPKAEAAAERK